MLKLKVIIAKNKLTFILTTVVILIFTGGFLTYQKFIVAKDSEQVIDEIDLNFDPEGPYAVISPRRDGNAMILNLKRTASYDKITYELSYNSEGIDRGVMGEINTKEKKGEYEQEILFGTCSKNVCKYDKNVENGTLILHIRRGKEAFRMLTQWRLQKPDVALGVLSSGDSHFTYKISSSSADLAQVKFTIINDLTGAPKLASGKQIVGKVYSINQPSAKVLPPGQIILELADKVPNGASLAVFNESQNNWQKLTAKTEESRLTASAETGGIFAVLIDQKQ